MGCLWHSQLHSYYSKILSHRTTKALDLLLSVINVSIQTVDIVNHLPKLKFD